VAQPGGLTLGFASFLVSTFLVSTFLVSFFFHL